MPSPQDIARQFSLQANQYGQVSSIQETLAQHLWNALVLRMPSKLNSVLDVGAGTGHLSMHLAQGKPSEIQLLDLSSQMLAQAAERLSRNFPDLTLAQIEQDADVWNPVGARFDLIASSAAIQWFKDFPLFCHKCSEWLNPNGLIALGTFGTQTLKELHLAYLESTGQELQVGTRMFSREQLHRPLLQNGFTILEQGSRTVQSFHQDPRSILRDLKKMGVTGGNQGKGLNRRQLQKLESSLANISRTSDGRYALTWELEWVVAKVLSK